MNINELIKLRNNLKESLRSVEDEICSLLPTWQDKVNNGMKIRAIQQYRIEHSATLLDAKHAVDNYIVKVLNDE